MLKLQKNIKNFWLLLFVVGIVGCNGRPTYDIFIYDLESFCDGHTVSRFAFDPEPENVEVKMEPKYVAQAEQQGLTLRVEKRYAGADIFAEFKCGAICKFRPNNDEGECICPETCHTEKCVANLTLRGYRYPSNGPGYRGPMAPKPGEDLWLEDKPQSEGAKKEK